MSVSGILLKEVSDVDPQFLEIIEAIAKKEGAESPKAVWAVYCAGKLIAVYFSPEQAFARLLNVIEFLNAGQEPVVQTLDEIHFWKVEPLPGAPVQRHRRHEDGDDFQP